MSLVERLRAALNDSGRRPPMLLEGDDVLAPMTPPGGEALSPAAVLVPITDRPEPGVILTQRSDNLRRHAGKIQRAIRPAWRPGNGIDAAKTLCFSAACIAR